MERTTSWWSSVAVLLASSAARCDDVTALRAFYESTDGANWPDALNVGWLSGGDPCEWTKVICNEEGQVSELRLNSLHGFASINGTLPTELGLLTEANVVAVFGTQLSGALPTELGMLTADISVDETSLSGTLPTELLGGGLEGSRSFGASHARIGGHLPTQLGRTHSLRLDRSDPGISGTLPTQLGTIVGGPSARIAWHKQGPNSNGGLSGTLPTELGEISELFEIKLEYNRLSGSVPAEMEPLVLERGCQLLACRNRLEPSVVLASAVCTKGYDAGDCDIFASPEERNQTGPGTVFGLDQGDTQCRPCRTDALVWFVVLLLLLALGVIALPLVSKLLLDPSHVLHISPLISAYQLLQVVILFKPSLGNDWPPRLQSAFDTLSVFAKLSLDDLDTECALGIVVLPQKLGSSAGTRQFEPY